MNVRDSFNAAQSHAIQVHLDAQLSHRPSSATVGRIRETDDRSACTYEIVALYDDRS